MLKNLILLVRYRNRIGMFEGVVNKNAVSFRSKQTSESLYIDCSRDHNYDLIPRKLNMFGLEERGKIADILF